MFRLELSYPMLILDSREYWLIREQEACRNYTEIQTLTEGLGAPLFSAGMLYLSLGAGKQENRTGKIHCKQTHGISST